MVLLEQHQTQLDLRVTGNFTTNSSSIFLSLTILGVSILVDTLIGSTLGIEPSETSVTYGRVPISGGLHCDIVPNRFSSFIVSGQAQAIYQIGPDYFEGVPGKAWKCFTTKRLHRRIFVYPK